MRLDLIEIETKHKNSNIILLIILVTFFIVFFSIMGMHFAKLYKAKLILSKKSNESKLNVQNNSTIGVEVEKDNNTNTVENKKDNKNTDMLLPVYSENARNQMKNIYKGNSKIAYLTFDDGPSQAVTPLILDLLKKENIKVTFFVLGCNVKANPEILKEEYEEGHYIANHGYTHNYAKIYKNTESVMAEYTKTEKAIQNAIGNKNYSSHLFRFPGGYAGGKYASIKKQAGELLNKNNISYIDWNALTGDAEGANTKEKIIKNIKKYTKNKNNLVVLMHDSSTKILTYETLKDVINYLKGEGYTFDNFYSIMK